MMLKGIAFPILLASIVSAQQSTVTYKVIAAPESNSNISVVVVIDNNTAYPLVASANDGGLLYQGQAPIAQAGYHYAIVDNSQQVIASEAFSRAPVQDQTTYNEFFNRSTNVYDDLVSLPQVMDPISAIKRVKSDLHIDNQIPTLHIWGNATAVQTLNENQLDEDLDVELNMTYYGLDNIQTFKDIEVSVAGRSSRYVPKLSYNIKIKKKSKDTLFGYKRLKLRAMSYDPSYIRERIAFATLKSVGVPCTEYSYIRVFFNNKAAGFYGLIETFQDPWAANEFANGDKDYKPGYLYQGQAIGENQKQIYVSDLSYYGENTTIYSLGQYKIRSGTKKDEKPKDYEELKDFTKFVNQTTSATTVDEWNSKFETDGFMRALAVEDLLGFSDTYTTLANNYFVYSEPETKRMIYIPIDIDTSIGLSLFMKSIMNDGNYSSHPGFNLRPLTKHLFSNPEFLNYYQQLRFNLSQTLVNPSIMYGFIDSVVKMIHPDVEWDQNLPRLGKDIGFKFGDANPENLNDLSAIKDILPPGIDFGEIGKAVNQTLEEAVGGNINSTVRQSIKQFLHNKYANVVAFYNQSANAAL